MIDPDYINFIEKYYIRVHGYDITLRDAENLWSKYSDDLYAGWLINDWEDFDTRWKRIKYLFKNKADTEDEFEENLKEQEEDMSCLMNYEGCYYEIIIEVSIISKMNYNNIKGK